jgi:S-(hydroxymethyl)glutathione dehydrogenase/alcohol dehydrogenase
MKTVAAVLIETGKPLELLELEIPALKNGQVLVELACSGVCHTQVLECRGHKGKDPFLPHCMGHEGSGVVREIGPGVTKVKPGDRVVLSWIKGSGLDVPGTVYESQGRKVNAGGVTTFARESVISENRLFPLPDEIAFNEAALLGCAIPTGLGVVFNTAGARRGQSAAVFGAGGIGLCAIAGAALAGCEPIIAVDVLDEKLALAKAMGATHAISPQRGEALDQIRAISKNGVDLAFEATGRPLVMLSALQAVKNQGGIAVVIGNAHHDEVIPLDPKLLNMGKQLRGSWGGDNVPDRDFPKYCDFLLSKQLNVAALISKTYSLEQINEAIDDLEAGRATRPLIQISSGVSDTEPGIGEIFNN